MSRVLVAMCAFLSLLTAVDAYAQSAQEIADLTIRRQRMFGPSGGTTITETFYFKGGRQRRQAVIKTPTETHQDRITIVDCNTRRTLILNPEIKVYAYQPDVIPWTQIRASTIAPASEPSPEPASTITVDSVDSGERRQIGSYTAHRVKTTTTTTSGDYKDLQEQDGWYIDLPDQSCGSHTEALLVPVPNVTVERRGTARRGFAIEEKDSRVANNSGHFDTRLELLEFSETPLEDVLFEVPRDYVPALPLPHGGHDLTQPDTFGNRLRAYWNATIDWVSYWLRW